MVAHPKGCVAHHYSRHCFDIYAYPIWNLRLSDALSSPLSLHVTRGNLGQASIIASPCFLRGTLLVIRSYQEGRGPSTSISSLMGLPRSPWTITTFPPNLSAQQLTRGDPALRPLVPVRLFYPGGSRSHGDCLRHGRRGAWLVLKASLRFCGFFLRRRCCHRIGAAGVLVRVTNRHTTNRHQLCVELVVM